MRVAVNDRQVARRAVARKETRRAIKKSLVEMAPLGRHELAEAVREPCKLLGEPSQIAAHGIAIAAMTRPWAQAHIVPPLRMESRSRLHNAAALLHRRRQWPGGRDDMRIGEIFEEEMPCRGVRVLRGFEAPRDETRRHDRGDIPIECDLSRSGAQ